MYELKNVKAFVVLYLLKHGDEMYIEVCCSMLKQLTKKKGLQKQSLFYLEKQQFNTKKLLIKIFQGGKLQKKENG
ncbi:hypothetical protein M3612_03360 [Niallia taxi]|uniref:hypothetical protein n=1 Tax=Niallia taxi TaxID=2499688 RepID=UPI00203FA733|nr:hypothetical protein [Niallia taxi]MCM3213565.1 hypothetical protein [Niallia taxi]